MLVHKSRSFITKWPKILDFAHSETTNKLVNEAAWVSMPEHKKPPTPRTNQLAGFGDHRIPPTFNLRK